MVTIMLTATTLPSFYSCPKKQEARQETIINLYHQYFQTSLPKEKQYWTMCGTHGHDGVFAEGSELGQILHEKLITPDQFFGVDNNPSIIDNNKLSYPGVNWICDDFFVAMKKQNKYFYYNPGIVNADFISMPHKSISITSQIMYFLDDIKCHNVMLISNMMLVNPHDRGGDYIRKTKADSNKVIRLFEKNEIFDTVWRNGNWKIHPENYKYGGTGEKSRTTMGTFIFIKN